MLPEQIEKIEIKNASIIMENGLTIKNKKIIEENGKKVIYIELEGVQTEYLLETEHKGTILVLNTDIILKDLVATATEKIVLNYTNENEEQTNTV